MKIEIIQADITRLKVDAIVNASNTTLLGGGQSEFGACPPWRKLRRTSRTSV